jgi:three-Cys-motif partner protein
MATTRMTSKPKPSTWGNKWTIEKLNAFKKYVDAYLTIMEVHKTKYGWKTLYFDGFAGSGDLKKSGNNQEETDPTSSLLDLEVEEAEVQVYKGAAESVLSLPKKFDYYYFVDKNKESLKRLEQKLEPFNVDNRLIFRDSDANEQIKKLAAALKKDKKLRALVLLDPFGMQINWESIELLKDTKSDVWILVPSGVIVNRLLDKKGELIYSDKLCSFFGMAEDEIRKEFYDKKVSTTLFGEETRTEKISDPIRKIADLYIKRLLGVWEKVTPEPLVMRNTKNVPIFHFVFASNNQAGLKIAKNIIGKD